MSPRGNIVDRGGAEVDDAFRVVTVYHVIFVVLYCICYIYYITSTPNVSFLQQISMLYDYWHMACDIINCHPAIWPVRLLEISMRYNNENSHTANWQIRLPEINMRYNNIKFSIAASDAWLETVTSSSKKNMSTSRMCNVINTFHRRHCWVMGHTSTTSDIPRENFPHFADDIALLSYSQQHIQCKTERLHKYAEHIGLGMSTRKT